MSKPSYVDNFEVLTAVITYMAMDKFPQHQPKWFANQLLMDVSEIRKVLDDFGGLFRKSKKTSKDHDDSYYSLHLRNARQELDEGGTNVQRPALELSELMELLNFVARKANEERHSNIGITTALVAAGAAVLASVTTMAVTFLR